MSFVDKYFESKMSMFVVILLALFSLTACENKEPEFYPDTWYQLDIKAAIDNERLFKKYKECYLHDNVTGCPRNAMEIKKNIPDILRTLCDKCTPAHIEAGRLAINYTCLTRRKDYDEVKAVYDPDGSVLRRAEEKYGKMSCE